MSGSTGRAVGGRVTPLTCETSLSSSRLYVSMRRIWYCPGSAIARAPTGAIEGPRRPLYPVKATHCVIRFAITVGSSAALRRKSKSKAARLAGWPRSAGAVRPPPYAGCSPRACRGLTAAGARLPASVDGQRPPSPFWRSGAGTRTPHRQRCPLPSPRCGPVARRTHPGPRDAK